MTTDPIEYEREDARTRASFAMPGNVTIVGYWGTGDLQATRNLAQVLADRFGDVSELLQASEQRVNRVAGDMQRVRTQLREALDSNEHLRFDLEAARNRNDGLQRVVNVREQEIAAILARLDRGTADLIIELTQLRVQADGGRQAAVEQMLRDAATQRQQAEAKVAALEMQVQVLKDHNVRLNADLRHAEEQLINPDPWYDGPGLAVEWGTRHTLISHDGIKAEPIIMNLGADRARALERYHEWHAWGMSDQVEIELVRRPIIRKDWIPVAVPQQPPQEVNDGGALASGVNGADLGAAGE